jgi:hypothetical protein
MTIFEDFHSMLILTTAINIELIYDSILVLFLLIADITCRLGFREF